MKVKSTNGEFPDKLSEKILDCLVYYFSSTIVFLSIRCILGLIYSLNTIKFKIS